MNETDRIAALEARLARVEDELAIHRLLATYGPLADAGNAHDAADLWVEEGVYDPSGAYRAEGRAARETIYTNEVHQALIQRGSMHMTAPVQVTLDGDEASAVGYSLLALNNGESFALLRASINRWTLRRTGDGWRIVERVNQVLDGSAHAYQLLESVSR